MSSGPTGYIGQEDIWLVHQLRQYFYGTVRQLVIKRHRSVFKDSVFCAFFFAFACTTAVFFISWTVCLFAGWYWRSHELLLIFLALLGFFAFFFCLWFILHRRQWLNARRSLQRDLDLVERIINSELPDIVATRPLHLNRKELRLIQGFFAADRDWERSLALQKMRSCPALRRWRFVEVVADIEEL